MYEKIEAGKQLGINRRICKDGTYFWYSYAVQKAEGIYYVYECEIAEEKMAAEEYEYEYVNKYVSIEEVKNNFIEKYGITFSDVKPLKGQHIFNVKFYI